MKKYLKLQYLFYQVFFLLIILATGCTDGDMKSADATEPEVKTLSHDELVERGKFIALVGDCGICHTPKKMTDKGPVFDDSKMLSGYPEGMQLPPINMKAVTNDHWVLMEPGTQAFVGPWGVSFAYNLTPDSTTGIGGWDEETFIRAMRTGMHMGAEKGRPIMPPMPWENLKQLSDEDLKALYTYLRTIPPIKNRVPDYISPDQLSNNQTITLVNQ